MMITGIFKKIQARRNTRALENKNSLLLWASLDHFKHNTHRSRQSREEYYYVSRADIRSKKFNI
jgi:hypothetical protein